MIVILILIAIFASLLFWRLIFENNRKIIVDQENAISYHQISAITKSALFNKISRNELGRCVIMVFYNQWCDLCHKQFPIINEVAREFQNTNLTFVAVSVDINTSKENFANFLEKYDNVYFKPYYLSDPNNLQVFMQKIFKIGYKGALPFFALFDSSGRVVNIMSGFKKARLLKKAIYNILI